ncbi:hypothetical protein EV692_1311 [Lonepinella koalarum]|uniref:Uncharacterized protein n=1 Tax=Lonepinella koalarum TaxID=53417 RepID=A0A4R1KXG1_9PAST|nr:hypothetical protein EV692_1311 [Lonepinella koalarum]
MTNYSKTKLKIQLKKGLEMETNASPFIRVSIGLAIILTALSIFALSIAPLISVIRWW